MKLLYCYKSLDVMGNNHPDWMFSEGNIYDIDKNYLGLSGSKIGTLPKEIINNHFIDYKVYKRDEIIDEILA